MAFADQIFLVYHGISPTPRTEDRLQAIQELGANAISIPFACHSPARSAPHRLGHKILFCFCRSRLSSTSWRIPLPGIQPFCQPWATDEGPVPALLPQAEKIGFASESVDGCVSQYVRSQLPTPIRFPPIASETLSPRTCALSAPKAREICYPPGSRSFRTPHS
jgi:hypothetical protein